MYNETTQETIIRIQAARRLGCRACIFSEIDPDVERDYKYMCHHSDETLNALYKKGDWWCQRWLHSPDVPDEQEQEVKF